MAYFRTLELCFAKKLLNALSSSSLENAPRTAIKRCSRHPSVQEKPSNRSYCGRNESPSLSDNTVHNRIVPKISSEAEIIKKKFVQPKNAHMLTVAILGQPNAGKSTLTNMLMGWRVCSVSKKVHTTKHNTKAILVEGNKQIVFLDTPGLVSLAERRRHKLDWKMLTDPKSSLDSADLIIVLLDASNVWTRNKLDAKIIQLLEEHQNKISILVLNKVDLVKSKKILLDTTKLLTKGIVGEQQSFTVKKREEPLTLNMLFKKTEAMLNENNQSGQQHLHENESTQEQDLHLTNDDDNYSWSRFDKVFMLSALHGDGVEQLKKYLLSKTHHGKWKHNPNLVTDQNPHEIALMAVREKLLDYLPQEIPYNIGLTVEMWEVDENGILRIVIEMKCPLKNYLKLVIGPQGTKVSRIAQEARQELMNTFHCEVSLKLVVQYKKANQ